MGHTNSTPNLHLPQFVGSDKPTWLSDVNGAMLAIDTAYGTIEAEASSAATAAAGAVTTAGAAQTAADAAASAAATAGTNASQAISTANNAASVALQAQTDASEAQETAVGKVLAEVTADGVKTNAQLLAEIWAAINIADVTPRSVLSRDGATFPLVMKNSSLKYASGAYGAGDIWFNTFNIGATCSVQTDQVSGTTNVQRSTTDYSSTVPTSGTKFTLYA